MVQGLDQTIGFCKHFIWREALWLPKWVIYAMPLDQVIESNIRQTAMKMDLIRNHFNRPIKVTSWYRPLEYNKLIGGARKSAHIEGLACDFIVSGLQSSVVRSELKDYLKKYDIRMEKLNTPHVHIDLKTTANMSDERRFFMP